MLERRNNEIVCLPSNELIIMFRFYIYSQPSLQHFTTFDYVNLNYVSIIVFTCKYFDTENIVLLLKNHCLIMKFDTKSKKNSVHNFLQLLKRYIRNTNDLAQVSTLYVN